AWRREPGVWDCCALPAAWSLHLGTADPMAGYRGAYSSEAEAEDIIARAGGLVPLFTAGLESVGWQRVGAPAMGDIGIIGLLGEEAGAVYTGGRWAFVAERGLGFVTLEGKRAVSRVWRLGGG